MNDVYSKSVRDVNHIQTHMDRREEDYAACRGHPFSERLRPNKTFLTGVFQYECKKACISYLMSKL